MSQKITVGEALGQVLTNAGLDAFFSVPGDYNLLLLDELLLVKGLKMVGCCNELNAGYAADGYARVHGIGMVVVTYMVGGLSAINAIAGAYSDDLPVLIVSGAPNSNSEAEHRILHHTTGSRDYYEQSRCFEPVVYDVFHIRHIDHALHAINDAVWTCLNMRKPVYLEIACNLFNAHISPPNPRSLYSLSKSSDAISLQAAVDAVCKRITESVKPVLVGGAKLRSWNSEKAFIDLAESVKAAVAMMPDAKSFFPEDHPLYIGTYWGPVSSLNCSNIVESSDCYIFVGPVFSDYTTTGRSTLLTPSKLIEVHPNTVNVHGSIFSNVLMEDFLTALAAVVPVRDASMLAYQRIHQPLLKTIDDKSSDDRICSRALQHAAQDMLTEYTNVFVDVGDSWFLGQGLQLPPGCRFHIQMQYGSTGWSVGAALGAAIAGVSMGEEGRRVLVIVGDGAFQMAFQEVSTIIREGVDVTMLLLNNGGYTIDVEIHDGPYNKIQNWDYAGLVEVFNNDVPDKKGISFRIETIGQLRDAIDAAKAHSGFALLECMLDITDCTPALLEWGSRIFAFNTRGFARKRGLAKIQGLIRNIAQDRELSLSFECLHEGHSLRLSNYDAEDNGDTSIDRTSRYLTLQSFWFLGDNNLENKGCFLLNN
eukprot:gene570-1099_t